MSVTKVIRKARKAHACDRCQQEILPGNSYLTHTALRGDEYGYHEYLHRDTLKPLNQPNRLKECARCASRYGRADLLTQTETTEAVPAGAASSIPKKGTK